MLFIHTHTQNKLYIFISQCPPLVCFSFYFYSWCSLSAHAHAHAAMLVGLFGFSMSLFFAALHLRWPLFEYIYVQYYISLHFNTRSVICQVWVYAQWVFFRCFVFSLFFKPSSPTFICLSGRKCADICRNRQLQSSSSPCSASAASFFNTSTPVYKTIRTRALTFLFNLKRNETRNTRAASTHTIQIGVRYTSIVTLASFS